MKKTSEEIVNQAKLNYTQPFFIGYNMLIESLKHNNIKNGLSDSLELAQIYLECDDIILYNQDDNNNYKLLDNSPISDINDENIDEFINTKNIGKINYYRKYYLDNEKIKNISLIPLTKDKSYVIAIVNSNKENDSEYNRFISILKETFTILISKMNSFNDMKEQTEIDALTGLKNRQAYNKDIKTHDENNTPLTFTILDLFRLKYINDNINHFTGDCYIKKTAEILKYYFPEKVNIYGKEEKTGDEIYRIGGDEFIIISTKKTEGQVEAIMEYVTLKTEEMDLNIGSDVIKGINYGTVSREDNDSIETLYKKADRKMSEDKQKIYIKYGLNRRK